MRRKDGSGSFVMVTHEIATQPGVVEYTQYLDVANDPGIKVQGDDVLEYPKLPEMKPVSLKVLSWRANDKKFIVTRGELAVV